MLGEFRHCGEIDAGLRGNGEVNRGQEPFVQPLKGEVMKDKAQESVRIQAALFQSTRTKRWNLARGPDARPRPSFFIEDC